MSYSLISYISAAAAFGIALFALIRNHQSPIDWVFAVGVGLFGLEALTIGLSFQSLSSDDALYWQWRRLVASSLIPGVWFIFSICFARANYQEFMSRWLWLIVSLCVVPPCVALFFHHDLFIVPAMVDPGRVILVRLDWAGYLLHLIYLVSAVLILMNFERTLRHATGHSRWQVKYIVLSVVVLFGVRLYADSQAVLYRLLNSNFDVVYTLTLLLSCGLIARSLVRAKRPETGLYLSHSLIYNSFTVLIVGVYFVLVAVAARFVYDSKAIESLPIIAFIVLVSLVGLAVLLLSDKLRFKGKRFISRHFRRPIYDYQSVWSGFTENTASLTSITDLCLAVTALVSQTLDVLAVSLWLVDEREERLDLGYSTMLTEDWVKDSGMSGEMGHSFLALMLARSLPIDLYRRDDGPIDEFVNGFRKDLEVADIRYCVPLRVARGIIGVITLGERVMKQPLTFEDYELLRTIGDQSAAALLNLKLSEKLRQTKELEAFQVMSAFFMHDLKNLASKLSLVTQNMPRHFDNEDFRQDAMQTVTQSVEKIKGMCSRLSLLSSKIEMHRRETDVNELIRAAMAGLGGLKARVELELCSMPLLQIDGEQMQKVFENLLINANEAVDKDGRIRIAETHQDSWVELSFSDNGCGMSKEFVEKNLFRPFQTTKKQGMGIGLFHCKTIVEAHGGRIEVESEEGKGSTFRVVLPVTKG
jgi:putative PEP-CTERM system histidine kinase